MTDSDEFDDFSDTDFLEAATQFEQQSVFQRDFAASPRPLKRRRLSAQVDGEDVGHGHQVHTGALGRPQAGLHARNLVREDGRPPVATSANRRNAPVDDDEDSEDAFEPVTAPPPARRQQAQRGVAGNVNHDSNTGVGRMLSTRAPNRPTVNDPVQCISSDEEDGFAQPVYPVASKSAANRAAVPPPTTSRIANASFNPEDELADLPSDAFESSSPQKPPNDVILISSQASRSGPATSQRQRGNVVASQNGLRQTTLFGRGALPASQLSKRLNFPAPDKPEPPTHHELDLEALNTWVYPTNLGTIRDYQYNIVARGLFHNLLVALPTGLGKTFIAATIMLNWFRWTKSAQIVFMAPTKPLVAQQIEACFGIAGIPRRYTTMLNGSVPPGIRAEEWQSKRVLFMTPETMRNDLKTGICDPKRIVLLVIDEAHRATGGYAYVEVVKFIRRFNESFRVLALTATPGGDVEAVQKVIDGLDISRVEIRTENSLDIRQYVYSRNIEKEVFDISDEMEMCMGLFSAAVQPVLNKITGLNAYYSRDPLALTAFGLVQALRKWQVSDAGRNAHWGVKTMVGGVFTALSSIAHSLELLKYHGIGPFYHSLCGFKEMPDVKGPAKKYRKEIIESESFEKLMIRLRSWVNKPDFIGHPKLEYIQGVVLKHLVQAGEADREEGQPPTATRIMVFAQYRDSAEEIARVLKRHQPMVRPHVFVGQTSSKNSEGMDQKKQLDIVKKFKEGEYNVLIATSIGEEGLDIGEVDLIICYDQKASPIRMLQRMGRTGRKRAGNIVLLQMRGKEEENFSKAKDSYERMQEMIADGTHFTFHEDRSRRIVPKEIQPAVDKRVVEIPIENTQGELPEPKRRGGRAPKRPPKKFHMPDGVRTGFVMASRMDDDEDEDGGDAGGIVGFLRGQPVKKAEADEALVDVAPLADVALNEMEKSNLYRRYQRVYTLGDDMVTEPPELDCHPERQRRLGRTHAFPRSGRAATAVAEMLQRVHEVRPERINELKDHLHREDLEMEVDGLLVSDTEVIHAEEDEPEVVQLEDDVEEDVHAVVDEDDEDDELPDLISMPPPRLPAERAEASPRTPAAARGGRGRGRGRGRGTRGGGRAGRGGAGAGGSRGVAAFHADDDVVEGFSSSPPATDPRMRLASQGIHLGSEDTADEDEDEGDYRLDSELAGFIAEDDEEVEVGLSSSLDLGAGVTPHRSGGRLSQLFTPTQRGVVDVPSSSAELPDLDSGLGYAGGRRGGDGEADDDEDAEPVLRTNRRGRRVVDSDEDEDEDD